MEQVRKPKAAGSYLMKALGYAVKGSDDSQGVVIGNRYGVSREIMPRYETINLRECADAAAGLIKLTSGMTDEIEELAPDSWLTPYGLSFTAGTRLGRVSEVIDQLAGPST